MQLHDVFLIGHGVGLGKLVDIGIIDGWLSKCDNEMSGGGDGSCERIGWEDGIHTRRV